MGRFSGGRSRALDSGNRYGLRADVRGNFNDYDILTRLEKDWVGNLDTNDPNVQKTFVRLRAYAYLSGDRAMQAMLNYAATMGLLIFRDDRREQGFARTFHGGLIIFGVGGLRLSALARSMSLETMLIHELGHAVADASGGPLNRQTPGATGRESYGGMYWENQWRELMRCSIRWEYAGRPPAC